MKDAQSDISEREADLAVHEREALVPLRSERSRCEEQLAQLTEQKGIHSRLIGEAKKSGENSSVLIDRMRTISAEMKQYKAQLETLDEEICRLVESAASNAGAIAENHAERGKPKEKSSLAAESNPSSRYTSTLKTSTDRKPVQRNIQELGENTEAWDEFVNANPATSIYHLSRWRDLIKNCFGHDSHYLQAVDADGKMLGVLPLVRLKSRLFGDYLVSVPYFNYGGAVAVTAEIESELMRQAEQLAQELDVAHIEFRDNIHREPWPLRTDKVAMILQLPGSVKQLEKHIGSKLRAQIKRAQREQPEVVTGGAELLDDFYSVFALNMRDLGTPVYSKEFFRGILQAFPEQSQLIVIRHQGKPVSTAFLLAFQQTVEIPWASTNRAVNKFSMNMLLYWEVLRYSIGCKAERFDFGRSSRDAGTYKFKKQWGAEELPLYWHYWLKGDGELPQLNPNNPKYQLAIRVWQHLPVAITKLIGPSIVKNLP